MKATIPQLLAKLNKTVSMSEGRRLTVMGAVKVNGVIVTDLTEIIDFQPHDLIQLGKQEPFVLREDDVK